MFRSFTKRKKRLITVSIFLMFADSLIRYQLI